MRTLNSPGFTLIGRPFAYGKTILTSSRKGLPWLRQRSCPQKSSGFSLIEILVVLSIITLTFGAIITTYIAAQRSSRDVKRQADLRTIQGGLQQYYADQNNFPISFSLSTATNLSLGSGSSQKVYLRNIPQDPTSGQSYCYLSSVSRSDSTVCSDPNTCQNYAIYAKLENPPSGAISESCGGVTYNFKLTPP